MPDQFVLIGREPNGIKAIGPFDDPDQARELSNALGLVGLRWDIVPLIAPEVGEVDSGDWNLLG